MRIIAPHDVHWIEYTLNDRPLAVRSREAGMHFAVELDAEATGHLMAQGFGEEGHARGDLSAHLMNTQGARLMWFEQGAGVSTLRVLAQPSWLAQVRLRDAQGEVRASATQTEGAMDLTLSVREVHEHLKAELLDAQGRVRARLNLPITP